MMCMNCHMWVLTQSVFWRVLPRNLICGLFLNYFDEFSGCWRKSAPARGLAVQVISREKNLPQQSAVREMEEELEFKGKQLANSEITVVRGECCGKPQNLEFFIPAK